MSAETVVEITPAGYKQTEVGVIPKDWEVVALESLGERTRPAIKAGPFGSSLTKDTYVAEGYKVYGQEQVIRGDYLYGDYYISKARFNELKSCAVEPGDILLSLVGTAGRVLVIPDGAPEGIINPRLIRFSFDRSIISPDFFKFLFETEAYQALLSRSAQGGTMGVLNAGLLRALFIPLPQIAEQEAIATALSDTDALIESLEQLIAKKRQIKQGAMQELLTGKRRLPGFSEEWEVKCVGDVLKIAHGRNQHAVEDQKGIYPILATGGQIGTANQFLYDKPSVLIGRKGTIDKPQFMDKPFWTVDTLFYSIILEPNNAKFLYYKFCLIDWKQYNEASGVPSLNARTIEQIVLKVPSSEEQNTIATILSDMDAEITLLEEKLAKTRQIKQGMMQELLTGRIRLV